MPFLEALVFTGVGRPGTDCFGPRFEGATVQVPVLDLGFRPGLPRESSGPGAGPRGAADRAGLCEGDIIDIPRYPEIVALNVGDVLEIGVTRDGETTRTTISLTGETVRVPQWRKRPGEAS